MGEQRNDLPAHDSAQLRLEYPDIIATAEEMARSAQFRYFWTTRADLLLLVAAASMIVFFVLAEGRLWRTDSGGNQLLRLAMPILLGGSFAAKILNRKRNVEGQWIQSRAVAERAKSLTWRFVMGVSPFSSEMPGSDVAGNFEKRLTDLARALPGEGASLQRSLDDVQVTPQMQQIRAATPGDRRAIYLSQRLDDQVDWYARRASRSKSASQRWYRRSVAIKALSLIAAIVAVFWLSAAVFVGFGTTLGASALAASKLGRHEEVQRRYAQAGAELATLRPDIAGAKSNSDLASAIARAEEVISREHAIWVGQL